MPQATSQPEFAELLASAYEILKEHQKSLYNLTVQLAAIKNVQSPEIRALLDPVEGKLFSESVGQQASQLRLFDESIARLRGT